MRKVNVDAAAVIKDYTVDKLGVEALAKKYHVGKLRIKGILKFYGIEMRGVGGVKSDEVFVVDDPKTPKYVPREGYHFEAVDEHDGFRTLDYMNRGGNLTTHIEKVYGVQTPTLYFRRMYYKRTGNYWWEQWFKIEEVQDAEVKKCPYCDWKTTDITNRSGAFMVHLMKEHGIDRDEYLKEHPEDREYFALVNPTLNLQMSDNPDEYVVCKVCGKKLKRLSSEHLSKHGLTKLDYLRRYGSQKMLSDDFYSFLSSNMHAVNENLEPTFTSAAEHEILEYVKSLGFECRRDRKVLHGMELDVYIPDKHLAIEYNGNMWHSEKFGKDRMYHLRKVEECNDNGIQLIQIFEDEFFFHKDIVFTKIRHILGVRGKDERRIPARKCEIREISAHLAQEFLECNHIQGYASSTIYLGGYFEGELVGVMTFLMEYTDRWNLTRFATKNDSICQGLGGKMFKYFVRMYDPIEVKSFADRRWTVNGDNNLYTKLGFKLDKVLPPDYRYYNPKVDSKQRFHKFGFRKQILSKKYGFPMEMSERDMTEQLGYTRIYDCGLFKYVWKKEV